LRSRRVGIATFWRLLAEHGTATAALAALPGVAATAGLTDYAICPEAVILAEVKAARACGARSVCAGDRAYPAALLDIPDPPPFLWARGDLSLLARSMVALVGARNASSLGERMARGLAADLSAAGHVVVSGLARGIDAAAHAAALAGGTVAVMAGGVDVIYPADNTALAGDILRMGLLVSEQPMGLTPQARHFPTRNRIISGLARAVVVVEAAAKSGSLITARTALDQGRDVMAVPGHPMDARASGCNMLIRDGATLVRDARDVIEVIGDASTRRATFTAAAGPLSQDRAGVDELAGSVAPKSRRGGGVHLRPQGTMTAPVATARPVSDGGATLSARPGSAGPGSAGLGSTGPGSTGPRPAGLGFAGSRSAGTGSAESGSAGSGSAGPRPTGSGSAGSGADAIVAAGAVSRALSDQRPRAGRGDPATPQGPDRHSPAASLMPTAPAPRPLREMALLHAAILDRLGPSPLAEDQLIRDLGAAVQIIAPALLDLEIEGRILRQPGGLLSRLI